MKVPMNTVAVIMDYFQKQQLKYNYFESGNVLQHKWDMRDVASQMSSGAELQQLIQFFMLYSDDKSMSFFFRHYDEYYETMQRVKADRLHRRYLQEQTLKSDKEINGES